MIAIALYALAAFILLDAFRLRARALAVAELPPSDEPVSPEHRFLTGPGVTVDAATQRAASAHARKHGLKVLDLWPANLRPDLPLGLLTLIDVAKFRKARLAKGFTAGQAMLVHAEVLERSGLPVDTGDDPVAFLKRALELKRFACTDFDYAVAPQMKAVAEDPDKRLALARAAVGDLALVILAGRLLWLAGVFAAALLAPEAAGAVLGVWMVRPVLILAGTPLQSPALFAYAALRPLVELWGLLRTAAGRWRPPGLTELQRAEAERPKYAELLQEGTQSFFGPRRVDCPVCGSNELRPFLTSPDIVQRKPGTFHLERCGGCGHIFQNPQLNVRGLSFYYRDFYDGLGAGAMESILGAGPRDYEARARMVQGHGQPAAWLDVGAGSGHLCCVARDFWPETRFDGLDLSAGIEEAHQRGWVDRVFRGLFPEKAPELRASYDVVSMSHYLEHTLDPRAEIRAAATVLKPGGLLLVEIPDPESRMGRFLRTLWMPWFQPQHLHLLSAANLDRLLQENGFKALVWHRGEAHLPVDLFLASSLLLLRVLPEAKAPWRAPVGFFGRVANAFGWLIGGPVVLTLLVVDGLLAPLFRRPGWSNAFRVLARLEDPAR